MLRNDRYGPDVLREFVGEAVSCYTLVHAVTLAGDSTLISLAQPGGSFDEGIQYRFEIERRAADDLENIGGRRLLLQRFTQLVEEARVLDGDDGLVGERGEQFYLFISESLQLRPSQYQHPDRGILA